MLDMQGDKLHEVADEIKSAGGEAIAVVGDVSKVQYVGRQCGSGRYIIGAL